MAEIQHLLEVFLHDEFDVMSKVFLSFGRSCSLLRLILIHLFSQSFFNHLLSHGDLLVRQWLKIKLILQEFTVVPRVVENTGFNLIVALVNLLGVSRYVRPWGPLERISLPAVDHGETAPHDAELFFFLGYLVGICTMLW